MAARLPKSNGFDQCTIAAQSLSSRRQPAVVSIPARPRRNRLPSSPASANRRFPSCSGHRGPTCRSCPRQSQRSGRGFGQGFEATRLATPATVDTTGSGERSRSCPHRGRQPVDREMFSFAPARTRISLLRSTVQLVGQAEVVGRRWAGLPKVRPPPTPPWSASAHRPGRSAIPGHRV